MGMPVGGAVSGVAANFIAISKGDIDATTQQLTSLLETYNEVNNTFIAMMNGIVGSGAFSGAFHRFPVWQIGECEQALPKPCLHPPERICRTVWQ